MLKVIHSEKQEDLFSLKDLLEDRESCLVQSTKMFSLYQVFTIKPNVTFKVEKESDCVIIHYNAATIEIPKDKLEEKIWRLMVERNLSSVKEVL